MLEVVLHAELQDARIAGLRLDAPERPRVEVGDRIPPVERVEQVERLEPQLQPLRPQLDEPRQRHVNLPERRTYREVPLGIAQGAQRRQREGGTVEVVV